jgi:protein-S-isoprenylcysteine O-methyltransferase Ste14
MRVPPDQWAKAAVVVLSWAWGFAEQYFAIRNRTRTGASQEKDRGSFLAITLSIAIGLTVACLFAFSGIGAFHHPAWWEAGGALLLLAGGGIRIHAIRTLARHFTSRVTLIEGHSLVRNGAYRWIRHPSYLGQILILVGFGAMLANLVALVAAPVFTTAALLLRIRVEERALAEHFGQAFDEYRRETDRLVPFVW